MKRKKCNVKLVYVLLILVSILGLSIVYAALSSTLNISGASEIKESSWNITLDVKSKYTSTGYFRKKVPTVDGHMAELTDIIVGAPTCTSETGNNADAELVCNSLSYSYRYEEGSAVEKGTYYILFMS